MWEDNGCTLRGNDFQRTMQQLEAMMMGNGFDALMATGSNSALPALASSAVQPALPFAKL